MRLLLVGFGAFCCLLHVAGFSGGVGCPLYISARIRTGGARSRSHVFDVNNGRRIAVFDAAAVPHRRCSMMSARHAAADLEIVEAIAQGNGGAAPTLTGVRSWTEEFEQDQYHRRSVMVDDGKLRKLEHNTLGEVERRDMERVLERGHGKSPGAMPHFGRIASEVVAKANKIKHREKNVDSSSTNGRKQPLTLNIVLHEWLEPRLTHSIAECSGGEGEEVTIFVGNEFFVDKKLLRERGHVLVPTGGTKKACLPQMVACMTAVIAVKALQTEGLLPTVKDVPAANHHTDHDDIHDHDVLVNMIVDGVAAHGVMASCLSEVRAATGAAVVMQQLRDDWESRMPEAGGVEEIPATASQGGHEESLMHKIENLFVSSAMPDLPVDRKREFVEALEAYREELKNGRQPLLMDAEGVGTHSEKRRPPFYTYHKLNNALIVAVASDPGVVRGLRARTGGIGAAEPAAVFVVEGSHQLPNSADSVLSILATEAFLMNLEQKNLPSTNQKRGQQEEPSETVIRPRIVPVDDDDSEHQEEQGREHMTVLVGRDGVLQDLIEIGELNGVKMARVADLPHDRVRGRERARNIKRTDSYRKTGRGVPRVPIGRRS